jgi:hypothetical protein
MRNEAGKPLADIPGENTLLTQAKRPVAPTKGRAFDQIGLEVKNS